MLGRAAAAACDCLPLILGWTVQEVIHNTGFELIIPDHVPVNDPPSDEELRLLREEIDPQRFYI